MKENIKELGIDDSNGFACNTPGCPCSADYGMTNNKDRFGGWSDVKCEDCAIAAKWITEADT